MNWLLLDGKLCIILFIVGDSGFETEAGFSVIVLVGKPLKAKGSGNIISFELKLIFCSCSVVSVFFLNYILAYRSRNIIETFHACPWTTRQGKRPALRATFIVKCH